MRYLFTATFADGEIEPGGGDAWQTLKIIRLARRSQGGLTLSRIIDQETGLTVSEADLKQALVVPGRSGPTISAMPGAQERA